MTLSARGALMVTAVTLGCLPDDWTFRSTMDATTDAPLDASSRVALDQSILCDANTLTDPSNCGACARLPRG